MGELEELVEDDEIVYQLTAKGFLTLLANDAGAEITMLADNALAVQKGAYTFVLLPNEKTYELHLTSEVEFVQ